MSSRSTRSMMRKSIKTTEREIQRKAQGDRQAERRIAKQAMHDEHSDASSSDSDSDEEEAWSAPSDSGSDSGSSSEGEPSDDEDDARASPSKRKRAAKQTSSPAKSPGKSKALRTPTKQGPRPSLLNTPQSLPRVRTQSKASGNAWEQARAVLHVGATPDDLPCREEQTGEIQEFVAEGVENGGGTGQIQYISGVPGCGKTAAVMSVINGLLAQQDESPTGTLDGAARRFRFFDINGLKLSDPAQAFVRLWEFVSASDADAASAAPRRGGRPPKKKARVATSPAKALQELDAYFARSDSKRPVTVLLIDELDQMLTPRQEVLYALFNWPHVSTSNLVVVAIANTMDLPEREFSAKINSRLGRNRLNFRPYTKTELSTILLRRLGGLENEVFGKDAAMLVCAKTASAGGDCRRMLDLARRCVEAAQQEGQTNGGAPRPVSPALVIATNKAIAEYGTGNFLPHLSKTCKLYLLGVVQLTKKRGLEECTLEEVASYVVQFSKQALRLHTPSQADLWDCATMLLGMNLIVADAGMRMDQFLKVRTSLSRADVLAICKADEILAGPTKVLM